MSDNDVIIEAFSELAPRYEEVVDGELRKFWGWSYAGFVERLIEAAAVNTDDLVLDVATGTAVIPRRLADRPGARGRVVGLDITLTMLRHAQRAMEVHASPARIRLVCASAMLMPFAQGTFDAVICGLGTHHMDVPQMLSEMGRVLKTGGYLTLADVAASPSWKYPGVKALLRVAALLYFLPSRNIARAWAEADAVSNVRTAEEWREVLLASGFAEVQVIRLSSHRFWSPDPLILRAIKKS